MMEWLTTPENLETTAALFWEAAGHHRIFAFHGEMGSGKTTFIHALCLHKKIRDVFSSPTFSLINEYRFFENGKERIIYHMDLYRVKNEQEAEDAGIADCLYSKHTCLVEWPEKIPHLLPDETCHVFIEITSPETRRVRIRDK